MHRRGSSWADVVDVAPDPATGKRRQKTRGGFSTKAAASKAMRTFSPKLALFFVWVFTNFVDRAFDSWIVPALGFVFLPWATLVYALAYDGLDVSPLGWFFVAMAFLTDISSYAYSGRRYLTQGI